MLSFYELYQSWSLFWTTYLIGSIFFPSSKSVVRSYINITNNNIMKKILNNCVVTALVIPLIYYIPSILEVKNYTIVENIIKYCIFFIIAEIWFYYCHRLFHYKYFYKWHKDHHVFIHPHALAGLYCHPVEMILSNQLSISIPFQLLGFNYYEIMVFSFLIALNVLKGHSGIQYYLNDDTKYKNLILAIFGNKSHDIHHQYMNVNYVLEVTFKIHSSTILIIML